MRIYGSDDLKYYYTNIWVGTPPQRQSVIIDTGSDYLAFPCSRCPEGHCGNHNNPVFNIENDKFKILSVGFLAILAHTEVIYPRSTIIRYTFCSHAIIIFSILRSR